MFHLSGFDQPLPKGCDAEDEWEVAERDGIMKCVVCKKVMEVVRKNTSINPKNKKKYNRTIYHWY